MNNSQWSEAASTQTAEVFFLGGGGEGGGVDVLLFPMCSNYAPNMFPKLPICLFTNMFPIAPHFMPYHLPQVLVL
jgi:hypothetical protein